MKRTIQFFACAATVFPCALPNTHVHNCSARSHSNYVGGPGQQLLRAAKDNTPKKFRFLLKQFAMQYRENSRGFFSILNARDHDGFNVLHLAAAAGDVENMDAILNTIETFYKHDTQGIFSYLTTRDPEGITILGLAEYLGNRRIMEQILIRAMHLIGHNKEMFFKFLNVGAYESGWKPLADASYDNQLANLEMMVKLAAHVLGRGSEYFKKFLDATDINGANAFSYADYNRIRYLLSHYNAEAPKKQDVHLNPKLSLANKYGLELNDASNQGNFILFEKALHHAYEFKEDPSLLFFFFSARNGAGWNPFINTAADGQYKYLEHMLKTMDELFPQKALEIKTQLMSNADFEGRTPLHLSILRRHCGVARLLIDTTVRYAINKPYLYAILNTPNELNGFSSFTNAVYGAQEFDDPMYQFVKYFVEKMAELFGRNSRMFHLFLNVRDYNGWTPLAYAYYPKLIELLKSYGAVDTPEKRYKGIGEFDRLKMEGKI